MKATANRIATKPNTFTHRGVGGLAGSGPGDGVDTSDFYDTLCL